MYVYLLGVSQKELTKKSHWDYKNTDNLPGESDQEPSLSSKHPPHSREVRHWPKTRHPRTTSTHCPSKRRKSKERKHNSKIKSRITFSNSALLWISASVGPAKEIGFVTPYCLARGGDPLNPSALTISQNPPGADKQKIKTKKKPAQVSPSQRSHLFAPTAYPKNSRNKTDPVETESAPQIDGDTE